MRVSYQPFPPSVYEIDVPIIEYRRVHYCKKEISVKNDHNQSKMANIVDSDESWSRGYKTFFMFNSAEHENFSANKYENANISWQEWSGIDTFILHLPSETSKGKKHNHEITGP